eukprot:COSAG05_NODE_2452_length_3047_cov_1.466418_1_plen_149_part_00
MCPRLQDAERLFLHYDRDNTGVLSLDDFTRAIRKDAKITAEAMSDAEIRELFEEVDVTQSNSISLADFTALLGHKGPADGSSSLLEAHDDDVLSCHLVHLEKPEETQRNSGKWADVCLSSSLSLNSFLLQLFVTRQISQGLGHSSQRG